MRIRRYVAGSVQEALERVRLEMGADALILQTRRLKPWWMPWRKTRFEVVAAAEVDRGRWRVRARTAPPVEAAGGARIEDRPWLPAQATEDPPPSRPAPVPSRPAAPAAPRREAGVSAGPASAAAMEWFQRLVQLDVDPTAAWEAVEGASLLVGRLGLSFVDALSRQLSAAVPTRPVWERPDRPLVVMLVGPTGVGKTTTVAKLAANFALVAGWRVGLMTADTYRIGAVQQLRTYAELMGLPLDVVQDAAELRQALAGTDRELVLVDTAGHSPGDRDRLEAVLELCGALPEGADVLLAVSAATRRTDLADVVEAYRRLPISGVCVTKLDETARRGALVNAPRWAGRPLAFLTSGQAVPDDIEAATPEGVARWVLETQPEGRRRWLNRPAPGGSEGGMGG